MPRQTMRDSVERQYPNARATLSRKSRRPLHLRIGLATFGMVIATFFVLTLMPLYWLAFVATILLTITLLMWSTINDRNREISDIYSQIDMDARRKRIKESEFYLDPVRVANQRRAVERAGIAPVTELRVGTAEREQVINLLGDHYAAGRLERDELDTRMDQAAKAKTAVQLAELLRDMP